MITLNSSHFTKAASCVSLEVTRLPKINISRVARQLATLAEVQKENVQESRISWSEAKPFSEIPGPESALKSLRNFLPGGKFHKVALKEMHVMMNEEYGDIVRFKGFLGRADMIICYDPKDFEHVYRNEGPWPHRREFETFKHFRKDLRPDVYGDNAGLLVEHGEKWKELRGMVNPVMMQPRVIKPYVKPVEEVAEVFIERIIQLRDSKNEMPNNFLNELNKWSLESIARISLDSRLGCLVDDSKLNSDSKNMIQAVHDFFECSFKLEVLPSLWKYIRTPNYTKLMTALDTMTNVSLKKIDEAVERINSNPDSKPESEMSVLEKLLKIDKNVAVIMAMDMLLAGVDTTSNTTAILLYLLAKNQASQEKLREEILTILPNKDSKLTTESFNKIPYLRACMKEANRVLPIAGGTMRKTPVDLVLSGYQIPKGTEVVMSHITTTARESQYPNPDQYLPERWLTGEAAQGCPSAKNAHRFVYMPFGFGPRSCVGKRFADLEVETLIVKLLRNHKVEWNYGELKVEAKPLTIPISPLKFKITEL